MRILVLMCFFCILTTNINSADWPHWRGPNQNGTSSEIDLIDQWEEGGDQLLWKADFVGRSTPIVMNDKVYVIGRSGREITEQEQIACFSVNNGDLLWDYKFNVFHTTIPFNRVGWASPVGDPKTGNVYVHGVQGMFFAFNSDGEKLWEKSLTETFGRISGYGGRTHTPFIDGNLVIISYLNTSWGSQAPGRHRYFAFDKNTGEVIWVSTPGGPPKDTTYSVPIVTTINDRRLLIAGNADGSVYAMDIRTGKSIWKFALSKQRGLNASVVADGHLIYASHGEENIDNTVMGRVVCIDGRGAGDITQTHEVWRVDGCQAGYSSPALHDGRLYVVDHSANLYAFDSKTGDQHWIHNIGTVGKGSPIWADGKIYVTEVNGHFHILSVGPSGVEVASTVQLKVNESIKRSEKEKQRYAEIYGSPAVANGRIFFTTEEGIYCLGRSKKVPRTLRLVPAEVVMKPGQKLTFDLRSFGNSESNKEGLPLQLDQVRWSNKGLSGTIDNGILILNADSTSYSGTITAQMDGSKATSRVRVIAPLPWLEDFEQVDLDTFPTHWIGAGSKFFVRQDGNNRILVKPPVKRGLNRSVVFIGTPEMSDYTIQVDLKGSKNKRRIPDMGLVANRYILDMQGIHQRLQVRSWSSDLRMAKHVDFEWDVNVWYTMKMQVKVDDGQAKVKGKVWVTGQVEPNEWSIEVVDPLANETGSPGIYGYSSAEIHYDNLEIKASKGGE